MFTLPSGTRVVRVITHYKDSDLAPIGLFAATAPSATLTGVPSSRKPERQGLQLVTEPAKPREVIKLAQTRFLFDTLGSDLTDRSFSLIHMRDEYMQSGDDAMSLRHRTVFLFVLDASTLHRQERARFEDFDRLMEGRSWKPKIKVDTNTPDALRIYLNDPRPCEDDSVPEFHICDQQTLKVA